MASNITKRIVSKKNVTDYEYAIWHIADLHIHDQPGSELTAIHEDILYAIDQLAALIKKEPLSINHQLLVIAGDVFQYKKRTSQYDNKCFYDILHKLQPMNILIIPGNHDFIPKSPYNLDFISAFLQGNNFPNVRVCSHNQVVTYADMPELRLFAFSPIDYPHKSFLAHINDMKNDPFNSLDIAIVHESPIPDLPIKYIIAGDTHVPSNSADFLIGRAYSGSLIQQDKSESLVHGTLKWTFTRKSNKVIFNKIIPYSLKLRRAYLRITAIDNKISSSNFNDADIGPNSKRFLQIRYFECYYTDCTPKFLETIQKKYQTKECPITFVKNNRSTIETLSKLPDISELDSDDSYLMRKMLESLKDNPSKKAILSIHEKISKGLHRDNLLKWQIDCIYWSNMYKYGKHNWINFSNLRGVYPIIGKNRAGKSTLINILLYSIYSKPERGFKTELVHAGQTTGRTYAKFTVFDPNAQEYIVVRKIGCAGSKGSKGEAILYKLEDTIWTQKFGGATEVNAAIVALLGPKNDLFLYNIAVQDKVPITSQTNVDIQTHFYRILGIDKIEECFKLAKEDIKTLKIKIEALKSRIPTNINTSMSPEEVKEQKEYEEDLQTRITEAHSIRTEKLKKYNPQLSPLKDILLALAKLEHIKKHYQPHITIESLTAKKIPHNIYSTKTNLIDLLGYISTTVADIPENQLSTLKLDLAMIMKQYPTRVFNKPSLTPSELILKCMETLKSKIQSIPSGSLEELLEYFKRDQPSNPVLETLKKDLAYLTNKYPKPLIEVYSDEDARTSLLSFLQEIKCPLLDILQTQTVQESDFPKLIVYYETLEKQLQRSIKHQYIMPNEMPNKFQPLNLNTVDVNTLLHQIQDPIPTPSELPSDSLDELKLKKSKNHIPNAEEIKKQLQFEKDCTCCSYNSEFLDNCTAMSPKLIDEQIKYIQQVRIRYALNTLFETQEAQYRQYREATQTIKKTMNDIETFQKWQEYSRIKPLKLQIQQIEQQIATQLQESSECILTIQQTITSIENYKKWQEYSKIETLSQQIKKIELKQAIKIQNHNTMIDQLIEYATLQQLYQQALINADLDSQIQELDKIIFELQEELFTSQTILQENQRILDQIQTCTLDIKEIDQLMVEEDILKQYADLINPTKGIPFQIFKDCHSLFEESINKILQQLTDFTIVLESSKMKIHIKIIENGRQHAAEVASGFQVFIMDLAMRLCMLANKKHGPNFCIIDEGFGVMDPDNLINIQKYIEILDKTIPSWMFIISHVTEVNYITKNHFDLKTTEDESQLQVGELSPIPDGINFSYDQ